MDREFNIGCKGFSWNYDRSPEEQEPRLESCWEPGQHSPSHHQSLVFSRNLLKSPLFCKSAFLTSLHTEQKVISRPPS